MLSIHLDLDFQLLADAHHDLALLHMCFLVELLTSVFFLSSYHGITSYLMLTVLAVSCYVS